MTNHYFIKLPDDNWPNLYVSDDDAVLEDKDCSTWWPKGREPSSEEEWDSRYGKLTNTSNTHEEVSSEKFCALIAEHIGLNSLHKTATIRPKRNNNMRITVLQLEEVHADCAIIKTFLRYAGKRKFIEYDNYNLDDQLAIIYGPLGRYWGWMVKNKLLPAWSMYKIDLNKVNLRRADLSSANLSRANLSGADLSGTYLSRANLSGADLSETNLSETNLSRADLSGANLSGANLHRTNLYKTDLYGVNF